MWPPTTHRAEASPDCPSMANDCLHWLVRGVQVVVRGVQVVVVVVVAVVSDTLRELQGLKEETQQDADQQRQEGLKTPPLKKRRGGASCSVYCISKMAIASGFTR